MLPIAPGEIQVKVGRRLAVEVDKALKVEVQLNGVHIGDFQEVGHHAVGPAPPPHVEIRLFLRIANNVPIE